MPQQPGRRPVLAEETQYVLLVLQPKQHAQHGSQPCTSPCGSRVGGPSSPGQVRQGHPPVVECAVGSWPQHQSLFIALACLLSVRVTMGQRVQMLVVGIRPWPGSQRPGGSVQAGHAGGPGQLPCSLLIPHPQAPACMPRPCKRTHQPEVGHVVFAAWCCTGS